MPLHLLTTLLLAHRYQLCNFTCADGEQWLTCRSEKCTPRLPEDMCRDGSEPTLNTTEGTTASDEAGLKVTGPQECAEVFEVTTPPGSFAERCEICLNVATELTTLWHQAVEDSMQSKIPPSAACAEATKRAEQWLPQVRTCRYHPPACEAVMAAARESVCPHLWGIRRGAGGGAAGGAAMSGSWAMERAVRKAQVELCGSIATHRDKSGVDDALVCPQPRDIGARVMAISAVVATCIVAAQLSCGVYWKLTPTPGSRHGRGQ